MAQLYGFKEQRDKNPNSSSYGDTRWIRDISLDTQCNMVKVLFMLDNTVYAEKNIARGTALGSDFPTPPTKPGKIFAGWFKIQGMVQITESTVITEDMMVHAQWTDEPANWQDTGNTGCSTSENEYIPV